MEWAFCAVAQWLPHMEQLILVFISLPVFTVAERLWWSRIIRHWPSE
jgi:hypothetical protein